MNDSSKILQIVPRLPGTQDGVGDYAATLAKKMQELYGRETVFATAESALAQRQFEHVILHYVNYGYQKRGVPFGLLSILRKIRKRCPGRLVTILHEIAASGSPWKSAFWLRPFQLQIARSIVGLSDVCIVSSETMLRVAEKLAPSANIRVRPVFSNFGEPTLSSDQLANRDPHRWVICGGTVLIERSVRSFRQIVHRIPDNFSAHKLFVLGGNENAATRKLVVDTAKLDRLNRSSSDGLCTHYCPSVSVQEASRILSTCSFAWLDYFHRPDVPTDIILKSSVFAALCAHGVIPVLPHPGSSIGIKNDLLPGPYFVDPVQRSLPAEQAKTAAEIYSWYERNAASKYVIETLASALSLKPRL